MLATIRVMWQTARAMTQRVDKSTVPGLFRASRSYDQSINWSARIARELPVIMGVFGPPNSGGILDAGCGTGHQAIALAAEGYHVTGADMSTEMLTLARDHATSTPPDQIRFVEATYERLHSQVGDGFDGLYCLGNALAAAGTRPGIAGAMSQFGKCVRSGGKLFIQILNFAPLCEEVPCVRGPRVSRVDDVEYISVREFHREEQRLRVTNISLWQTRDGWQKRANSGFLYPIAPQEIRDWLEESGFELDHLWGGYDRSTFDPGSSVDLIVVATRR